MPQKQAVRLEEAVSLCFISVKTVASKENLGVSENGGKILRNHKMAISTGKMNEHYDKIMKNH